MDSKPHKLVFLGLFCLFSCLGYANQTSFFIAGGPNFSTLKNNRLVDINEFITNAYQTHMQTQPKGFWGVGVHHTLLSSRIPLAQFSLGLAGYFLDLGTVKGMELPFINEGVFDSLNYNFHVKSSSLMVEAKAAYSPHNLQPFALVGVGNSWNRFFDYHEKPTDSSLSAAPATGFQDHTQQTFAYELGAGLQYQFGRNKHNHPQYKVAAAYHYFNLGQGALGRSVAQTANKRLGIKNLYTQGIVFSFAFSFG